MNTKTLFPQLIYEAAAAFGYRENIMISTIGNGLINSTFLVEKSGRVPMLLQQLNTTVFSQPYAIQSNYEALHAYLQSRNYFIPAFYKTTDGKLLWQNEENEVWRAFEYVPNSFSPDLISTKTEAETVAVCFGRFAAMLKEFPADKLITVLPHFHDLEWRYRQFEEALQTTQHAITGELKNLIGALQERRTLTGLFLRFHDVEHFPLRVMHHDCKISNILFEKKTNRIICPVDLDTVMPGKFFSDPGDMVRTMCCTVDENSTAWNEIAINETYYHAVVAAYRKATKDLFSEAEKEYLPSAGLLLIYMQALRFLTDYLNGNVYYKVQYEEQNFHRAKNQYLLLKSLEALLNRIGFTSQ
jgi:Ser/Thr protein kinase RdoA (MazF antagonist)